MGSGGPTTAEDFLREHGDSDSDFIFRSLFESAVIVSLDAMREKEAKQEQTIDDEENAEFD